jgi:predicted amino acid-binding ACT domain protein
MIITEETLRLQKLAGIISESQYKEKLAEVDINLDDKEQSVVDDVKDEMSSILKTMDAELAKASQSTNEGLLTIASIAIALPAIMGLVAKFGKAAGAMVNKVLGKKPTDEDAYNQWMNKLSHIADELHHLYMAPLEAIVKKFVKDPAKAKQVASALFHVIVASFLLASGVTAVKAFQAKNVSLATLEGALSAIKGGEIKTFISDLFK